MRENVKQDIINDERASIDIHQITIKLEKSDKKCDVRHLKLKRNQRLSDDI